LGYKRDEKTKDWRKLHDEECLSSYSEVGFSTNQKELGQDQDISLLAVEIIGNICLHIVRVCSF
jgi:hypothetical protein